jgi:tRNA uridine 5-carbamoylmethylation protein Kti12
MECVIFTGIPATGKSTFYRDRFYRTHVRINLDMLKTRNREAKLLAACLDMKQRFVVDNTNPTADDRARYIEPAKKAGFRVISYFFRSTLDAALRRNAGRPSSEIILNAGIYAIYQRLEPPDSAEGIDALFVVGIKGAGRFSVKPVAHPGCATPP